MAANVVNMSVSGEWICRDLKGWRVKVPCPGGHQYFSFEQYGGSVNALNKARAFHSKMCAQLKKDREYFKQHGEKNIRPSLNIRNRSGYTGISREVRPNLTGRPLVIFHAFYSKKGRQYSKGFSMTEYKHEEYALEAAIEWRESMKGHR